MGGMAWAALALSIGCSVRTIAASRMERDTGNAYTIQEAVKIGRNQMALAIFLGEAVAFWIVAAASLVGWAVLR